MKTKTQIIILILALSFLGLGSECGTGGRPQAKPFIDDARPVLPTATRPTPTPTKRAVLDPDAKTEKSSGIPIIPSVRINDLKAVNCNSQGVNDLCWAYKEVQFSWIDDICITWREWGKPNDPPGVLNIYLIKDGEKFLEGQYDEIGDEDGFDCRSHEIHNLPPGEYQFMLEQVYPSGQIMEEQWIISTPIPSATPTKTRTPTITPTPKKTATPTPPPTLPPLIMSDVTAIRWTDLPEIDGDLTEWAGVTSYETPFIIYNVDDWDGSDDLQAFWHISWDEKNLFLGVEVVDDQHVQTQSGNELYKGDSLTIYIDAELDRDFGSDISQDDFIIDLSPGDFAALPPSAYRYQAGNESPGHNIEVYAVKTKQGYSLEAAVPWEDLGLVPVEGLKIGAVLISTDNDTLDTAVQEVVKSNIEGFKFNDPSTWGTLTLE